MLPPGLSPAERGPNQDGPQSAQKRGKTARERGRGYSGTGAGGESSPRGRRTRHAGPLSRRVAGPGCMPGRGLPPRSNPPGPGVSGGRGIAARLRPEPRADCPPGRGQGPEPPAGAVGGPVAGARRAGCSKMHKTRHPNLYTFHEISGNTPNSYTLHQSV